MSPDVDLKGKGKERMPEPKEATPHEDAEDEEDEDGSPSGSGSDKQSTMRTGYVNRLREARIILHQVHFLLGDVYHQLGRQSDEDESYAAAEALRRSLLSTTEQRAVRAMEELQRTNVEHGMRERDLFIAPSTNPGKLTTKLVSPSTSHVEPRAPLS